MTLTDLTVHKETCKHRMINCEYCEDSYKPDGEEPHLQKCGLYWKNKCNERLRGMGVEEKSCRTCEKRLKLNRR